VILIGEFDPDDPETYVQGVDEYIEYLNIPKEIRKERNEKTCDE
jgi:hypothetical protein